MNIISHMRYLNTMLNIFLWLSCNSGNTVATDKLTNKLIVWIAIREEEIEIIFKWGNKSQKRVEMFDCFYYSRDWVVRLNLN